MIWNEYIDKINETIVDYACIHFPELNTTRTIYDFCVYDKEPLEKVITNISYLHGIKYYGPNPTRHDIVKLKNFYNNIDIENLSTHHVYVTFEHFTSKITMSLSKLLQTHCFDKSEAIDKHFKHIDNISKTMLFYKKHSKTKDYDYEVNGYKYLGWQNSWLEPPVEYKTCKEQGHLQVDVHHDNRGYENTGSCPLCKIYWKYDSSD